MSIGSVSTVPYVAPLPAATSDRPAADVPKVAAAASPALTSPPLLAAAATAILINQQGAGSATPSTGVDLSGQDLREVDLSKVDLKNANLKGANLSGKDLSGLDFSGSDLTGANLSGATLTKTNLSKVKADNANFSGATLVSANADGASFQGAKFAGAYIGMRQAPEPLEHDEPTFVITGTNFANADLSGATLRGVHFEQGNLEGANFAGANIDYTAFANSRLGHASFQHVTGSIRIWGSDASNVDFTHISGTASVGLSQSTLNGATFEGSSLRRLSIGYSDARNVNFNVYNRDLSKVSFGDVNLSGQDFSGFNLTDARFVSTPGAPVPGVDWTNSLDGTKFTGANLTGAGFYMQDASTADFSGASLSGAIISQTSFAGNQTTNLSGVNVIWESNLSGMNMAGADFSSTVSIIEANFTNTDLSQARFSDSTYFKANDWSVTPSAMAGLKDLEAKNEYLNKGLPVPAAVQGLAKSALSFLADSTSFVKALPKPDAEQTNASAALGMLSDIAENNRVFYARSNDVVASTDGASSTTEKTLTEQISETLI